MSTSRGRRKTAAGLLVLTAAGALTLSSIPPGAASPIAPRAGSEHVGGTGQRERKTDYDARTLAPKDRLRVERDTVTDQRAKDRVAATRRLTDQLGTQGVFEQDPLTRTPTSLGRLDGFLTKASSAKPTTITLRYVRANAAGLGLTAADLKGLTLRRDYVDVAGIHHLSWTQSAHGITVFGNGLKANVTRSGRLISVQGAPVSGLGAMASAARTTPRIQAPQARQAAAEDVGGTPAEVGSTATGTVTTWANQDRAQLVWFLTPGGLRLGWSTYVQAGGDLSYQHVIDAQTGAVLYRHDTVANDRVTTPAEPLGAAASVKSNRGNALVYDNYPGAPVGGEQKVYNLISHHFLTSHATTLNGAYVNAFADLNDNNAADRNELVTVPGLGVKTPQYPLVRFDGVSGFCSDQFICTWDPRTPGSWAANTAADVTQGFYFNSVYHNYLQAKPFGFTRAAGNFESRDGDAVQLNSLDGADTAQGLPDANHIDNANMGTPPDGIPPTMQMYLFHAPGTTDADEPFLPSSSSFDSSVILHEYTHGLSNRLVVDATGNSTLSGIQAGAMGEAWSDYYAEDYLVTKGLEKDTATAGDVLTGKYVDAGGSIRTMGIDCPVSTTSTRCTPGFGGTGGYTYGDFTRVAGFPEVHAGGEIWGQTLWDLRKKLGHTKTGMLVTRAMELAPADPSFLDMRNAILQADLAVYDGSHRSAIWRIFANRGMGFYAGTQDAGDGQPVEDFSPPPAKGTPRTTLRGVVTEGLTGRPLAKALVSISGHDSGYAGDYTAVTDAKGQYAIPRVFVGNYPYLTVFAPGYELLRRSVKVVPRGSTADFSIRRDWAASSGGGRVTAFNGPDFTDFGCGPGAAIDLSLGSGWGSTTGNDAGDPTGVMIPKSVVIRLGEPITVASVSVDPSNTCGDPGSSSTAGYRIETSADGTTWAAAAQGTFTAADRGRLNPVAVPATAGVAYVRFTILSPQVPDFATNCPNGPYGGCLFTDLTELEVFGTAQP